MCKMISFSQKALQRYDFLRTQPNKMHKNNLFVHKARNLCNIYFATFILHFARFALSLQA